jgi:hypothetical protein
VEYAPATFQPLDFRPPGGNSTPLKTGSGVEFQMECRMEFQTGISSAWHAEGEQFAGILANRIGAICRTFLKSALLLKFSSPEGKR